MTADVAPLRPPGSSGLPRRPNGGMRILVVGAGATGGYFGARWAQAGRDVTFLVSPRRAHQLACGLRLLDGDREETLPVRTVTADRISEPYDLVVLAVKVHALGAVVEEIRPAVGQETLILPFLNGMAHLETLDAAFGRHRVLGGVVRVSGFVTPEGAIRQSLPTPGLTLGPRDGSATVPARRTVDQVSVPGVDAALTDDAAAAMWRKWTFIAAAATATCLMRAAVGDIVAAAGGTAFIRDVIHEVESVAISIGHPLPSAQHEVMVDLLTARRSSFTSSLARDVAAELPHEGEHLLAAFADAADRAGVETPLVDLAVLQLRTHDNALAR